MQSALSGLLHDASALYRFVEFICGFCSEYESSQAYGDASKEFFAYVRDLGARTQEFLQATVDKAAHRPAWISKHRQKLVALKDFWGELHSFVKPAADGHSLRTPSSLLEFAEQQLRSLPGLQRARVVVLVSAELNYFQHQHSELKRLAEELCKLIPKAPQFPDQLGFIAIPYSQGSSVLTNTIIYHELGHFVFEELSKSDELLSSIDTALKSTDPLSKLGHLDLTWCRDELLSWAEETFCDLFALWLAGPAYAFASIELFGLLGVLDEDTAKAFHPNHPAHAFRFKEQLIQLKSQGWWKEIEKLKSESVQLIKTLGSIPESRYEPPFLVNIPALVLAFLKTRKSIRNLVAQTVATAVTGLEDFKKWSRPIRDCLNNGVVPSTLVIRGREQYPTPLAVINAASCFYLESLPTLIDRIENRDSRHVADRSELAAKLEMWTMKALEDFKLLSRACPGVD